MVIYRSVYITEHLFSDLLSQSFMQFIKYDNLPTMHISSNKPLF